MAKEGTYLEFTITNSFEESRSFYWYLSSASGSITDSDFDTTINVLESWRPVRADLKPGESKLFKLLLANDKLVERNDRVQINISVSSKNWWDKNLTPYTIEGSVIEILDPDSQITIKTSSTNKYKKVLPIPYSRQVSRDGKTRHEASEFKSIYDQANESGIICIAKGRALVEQYNYSGPETSFFYATKQASGKFIKAIKYEPLANISGYGNSRIKDIDFDTEGNAYLSHSYHQSENKKKPRIISFVSKYDAKGRRFSRSRSRQRESRMDQAFLATTMGG